MPTGEGAVLPRGSGLTALTSMAEAAPAALLRILPCIFALGRGLLIL